MDDELAPTPTLVSSRKLQAGNWRGEDGSASDTRLCCLCGDVEELDNGSDGGGKGAVNEKVDVDGSLTRGVRLVVAMTNVALEVVRRRRYLERYLSYTSQAKAGNETGPQGIMRGAGRHVGGGRQRDPRCPIGG